MSHWVRVKLKANNSDVLVRALRRMGCENVQTGNFTISQYGQSSEATIKVDSGVGFAQQADGTFEMVGDFYHSRDRAMRKYYGRNQEFQTDLQSAYAIEDQLVKLDELGFEIIENADGLVGEDGLIRMQAVQTSGF